MSWFALVPLLSCLVCTSFCFSALSRDPTDQINRASAAFIFAPAYWAFFEVVAHLAPDPETALTAVVLATPGWVFIPPLIVNLIVSLLGEEEEEQLARVIPWLFAGSAGLTLLNWTTRLLTPSVTKTPWGYAFETGPAFPFYFSFTMICALVVAWRWLRASRAAPVLGDERASWNITLGIFAPIVVASVTDGVLPAVGIQVPRLGTACFAFLAVMVLWASIRRGYMFASPSVFAREILKTLPDGVAVVDPDGRVCFVNAGLERSIGTNAQRITGTPIERFLPRPTLRIGEDLYEVECELKSVAGDVTPVSLSSCTIEDRRGMPLGLALVIRDIREVTSLRSRLITSGRLAAVGQLAAGIAHEINNPIAFVRANLGVLREHWTEVEKEFEKNGVSEPLAEILSEGEEVIDESLEGIDRAAGIVRDIREFSHAGSPGRESTDLNQLLDQVVRVAKPELSPGITIEKSYGELPLVPCSAQQIKQVLLNLIVNASHAVGESGHVRLITETKGNDVVITVEDDGCGIPEEVKERIFDPFFTTKEMGKGMGLGLSISYEIIRKHGGEIEVETERGSGSRFRVRLPIGN
jgi:PAS domain S-box-containing protein